MTVQTAERRREERLPSAQAAELWDKDNRQMLGRGRTANTSEGGVMLMVRRDQRIPLEGEVCLRLSTPPSIQDGRGRRRAYLCRIARRQELGNMLGLGLQRIKKLD